MNVAYQFESRRARNARVAFLEAVHDEPPVFWAGSFLFRSETTLTYDQRFTHFRSKFETQPR